MNSEIPSPVAGVLQTILAYPDQEIQVGEPLAIVLAGSSGEAPAQVSAPIKEPLSESTPSSGMEGFLSPSVMRVLREKGIPLSDIDKIPHTGQGGRLTKQDVEAYRAPCPLKKGAPSSSIIAEQERVKMSPMRKAIAENMVRSFYEAPHASLVTEVDVTRLVQQVQEKKEEFHQRYGSKLTITPFVARAMSRALQAFPLINSSLEGDTIVMKRYVNLGIAVSVDQGVMVPVIRGCQALSLPEISSRIAELAQKAREQRLTTADTQEGTITLTNFGMTGTLIGIPIIRYPEVAIIGLGAIVKKVVAMPDNSIAIRSMMMVSLTFDHRVLDGIYGCSFLGELKKRLEEDFEI